MYRIVFLLLSSMVLLNCNGKNEEHFALPYYNEPSFTPIFIEHKNEVPDKIMHTISNFSFLDQDSNRVTQKTIEGKIHVANFIFTSCGSICPTMTRNMKILSDTLQNNDDVVFLSYSVAPWIDKPAVLKKYKSANNIENKNWHFLTGSKSDIYTLARRSYFAEEDLGFTKDSTEFLHTEHFVLVDKNKRIRGIYNGTLILEMQQLIEDINTLKVKL
ncbi:SCO family protein [soil metagenome]